MPEADFLNLHLCPLLGGNADSFFAQPELLRV
jgi:hypothetical protein